MKAFQRRAFWAAWFGFAVAARAQSPPLSKKLPDGRSRSLELARRDHERALEDVAKIRELAQSVEQRLEDGTEHVVSLEAFEQLEQIEDLARDVRKRLKRTY